MKHKKKRKPGVQVKKYQIGGVPGGDPIRQAEQLAFAQLLQDRAALLDQGEIRQMPEGADRPAPLFSLLADPLGSTRAIMTEGRIPTPAELDIASQKAGPMADVLGLSYPALMASAVKYGAPAAGLVPHSTPFTTVSERAPGMRVLRAADQGDDAVRTVGYGLGDVQLPQFARESHLAAGRAAGQSTYNRRLNEIMSPEGQSRLRQEIADDMTMFVNYMDRPHSLYRTGIISTPEQEAAQRQLIKDQMVDGKLPPDSPLVDDLLEATNLYIHSQNFQMQKLPEGAVGLPEEELMMMDARVKEIDQIMNDLDKQRLVYEKQERKFEHDVMSKEYQEAVDKIEEISAKETELWKEQTGLRETLQKESPMLDTRSFYRWGPSNKIYIAGRSMLDPKSAVTGVGHEFRHAMQMSPKVMSGAFRTLNPSTQRQFLVLDDEMGKLTLRKPSTIPSGAAKDRWLRDETYYKTGGDGSAIEKTPYLDELRQAMVYEGYATGTYDRFTPDKIRRYIDEVYEPRLKRPSPDAVMNNDPNSLRILELVDVNKRTNLEHMADIMNRMSAIMIGAGGAAAATQDYRQGGKFKILKK